MKKKACLLHSICLFWNISHYLGCLGVLLSYYWTKKKQVTLCATSFLSDVVQFLHLQYNDSYDLFQSSSNFGAVADHFNWYIKLLFLSVHLKCWLIYEQWYSTLEIIWCDSSFSVTLLKYWSQEFYTFLFYSKDLDVTFISSFCFTVKQVKKELLANSKLYIVHREFTQHW